MLIHVFLTRKVLCPLFIGIALLQTLAPGSTSGTSRFNLLPIFESDAGDFIRLSLVNTSAANNEVTITWTASDGKTSRTANLSLAPGSQCVASIREILAIPEDPAQGWIRIDASEPGLVSYMTTGREGIQDSTESASLISTRIMLPHVAVNTGFEELDYTDTLINLINPGSAAARANLELIGLDGVTAGDLNLFIPARANRVLRVSESFATVLPPNGAGGRIFRGYLRISSDERLAGWLQIDTPLSRRLLRGRAAEEIVPARLALVSHFAFGSPALYHSALNFINAGDSAITLELAAQDNLGKKLGTARRTLKPGQGFREDVLSLFPIAIPAVYPPLMLTGYVRIRAADGGTFRWVGNIDITRDGNSAAMLYPIEAASSTNFIMPFMANEPDYFTGYAIANPNELLTVQTDITIELFDVDGRPVGPPREVSLSPSARYISLIEEKISSGYLRIRANAPVAFLGSMGAWNGNTLAPVPGIPCHGRSTRSPGRPLSRAYYEPFAETVPAMDSSRSDGYPACGP
jgi:hypothetical protein